MHNRLNEPITRNDRLIKYRYLQLASINIIILLSTEDILNVIFTNELHQIEWEHLISSTFIIIIIIITLICKFDGSSALSQTSRRLPDSIKRESLLDRASWEGKKREEEK